MALIPATEFYWPEVVNLVLSGWQSKENFNEELLEETEPYKS